MTQSLLDEIQPVWHVRSRHSRVVDAPPADVAAAWEAFRLDGDASPLVRFFIKARGLALPSAPTVRDVLTKTGFAVLGEKPGREIVFGVAGKFWAPREMANLARIHDAREYQEFRRPGQAKGAMSLLAEPMPGGRTLLKTETRVTCSDQRARLLFNAYWTLIRVPSGLIRLDMLRAIARLAEQRQSTRAETVR